MNTDLPVNNNIFGFKGRIERFNFLVNNFAAFILVQYLISFSLFISVFSGLQILQILKPLSIIFTLFGLYLLGVNIFKRLNDLKATKLIKLIIIPFYLIIAGLVQTIPSFFYILLPFTLFFLFVPSKYAEMTNPISFLNLQKKFLILYTLLLLASLLHPLYLRGVEFPINIFVVIAHGLIFFLLGNFFFYSIKGLKYIFKKLFKKDKKTLIIGLLSLIVFIFSALYILFGYGIDDKVQSEAYKKIKIFANEDITKKYNDYKNQTVKNYLECIDKHKGFFDSYKELKCGKKPEIKTIEPNTYILYGGSLDILGLREYQYDWKNEKFVNYSGEVLHKLSENDEYLTAQECWQLFFEKAYTPLLIALLGSISFYFLCFLCLFVFNKIPKDNFHIFAYFCIVILTTCVFFPPDEDYGFYTFTRLIITTLSGLIIYKQYKINPQSLWLVVFGIIALLFNPFVIISFEQETWQIIDFITVIVVGFYLWKKGNKKPCQPE